MVATVEVSIKTEKYTPNAVTNVPMDHPMARRVPILSAKSMAPTEETTRWQQTRRDGLTRRRAQNRKRGELQYIPLNLNRSLNLGG
jgi:hypothetical protein